MNFLTAHLRKSYVIGLVNGQEKLTITESILLRYTTAAVAAQCRQRRGKGGACAAASHWCSAVKAVSFQVDGLWILAGP